MHFGHQRPITTQHHSTEKAMLCVSDVGLLSKADEQRVTLQASLDMTAAFDCVDHLLLLMPLQWKFGLEKMALEWMTSFLIGRTQQVAYIGQLSLILPVLYGVPQGSVLGPLLFMLFTTELHDVVTKHGVTLHQYADDCQVYASTPVPDVQLAIDRLSRCMADVVTGLMEEAFDLIRATLRSCGWARSSVLTE